MGPTSSSIRKDLVRSVWHIGLGESDQTSDHLLTGSSSLLAGPSSLLAGSSSLLAGSSSLLAGSSSLLTGPSRLLGLAGEQVTLQAELAQPVPARPAGHLADLAGTACTSSASKSPCRPSWYSLHQLGRQVTLLTELVRPSR
ncbi:hypothetical protein PCASD_07134 [Puccinia coronata f. sp. avenae]|uniref:Uncharacterized protein n=1 Tax=Puccinia coronata f. sp. avenae TaxID=200324 RepID=A0A2N5T0H6_9BASI|nr:hypothetical protein PCASD_20116 [Puccinia coronata f. sp. avenae]PLW44808.1 hypothetical protein PCASD_07134 [Puccinia coronata f. sp. avenae]